MSELVKCVRCWNIHKEERLTRPDRIREYLDVFTLKEGAFCCSCYEVILLNEKLDYILEQAKELESKISSTMDGFNSSLVGEGGVRDTLADCNTGIKNIISSIQHE